MKPTSFLGSSEDTGNEVGRKRHYGKGKPVVRNCAKHLHYFTPSCYPRVYLGYTFGVEIEM